MRYRSRPRTVTRRLVLKLLVVSPVAFAAACGHQSPSVPESSAAPPAPTALSSQTLPASTPIGVIPTVTANPESSPTPETDPPITQAPASSSPTAAQQAPIPQTAPPAPATVASAPHLDLMIGQMLMIGFRGLAVNADSPIIRDIREHFLGGVVLFDYDVPAASPVRNIGSPAQLRTLVQSLQGAAPIPLLIGIDQEGGNVARLKPEHGFPATVSHQYLGSHNDVALTGQQATVIARSLRAAGINLNLAPVVDLNLNPDNPIIGRLGRSFGRDPAVVVAHAAAFIQAHHQQGILCALKHFPGHGSATGDTHLGLVDVTSTWSARELEPYRQLIPQGIVDTVMTAHVFNARLDPNYPATLSPPTITGILRKEIGFDGIVFSDDLQMGAIRDHYGFEAAIGAAINAGLDVLTIANNTVFEEGVVGRAVDAVHRLVANGTVAEARITESYNRIRRLKERLLHV